jgi:hypothetical protein
VNSHRHDVAQFLYPESEPAREHLRRKAEIAGFSPASLSERLSRCAKSTASKTRKCLKYKTVLPVNDSYLVMTAMRGVIVVVGVRSRLFVPERGGLASAADLRPYALERGTIAPMLDRLWNARYLLLPLAAVQLAYWGIQPLCWHTLHH